MSELKFSLVLSGAVSPYQANSQATGFDLTVVKREWVCNKNGGVTKDEWYKEAYERHGIENYTIRTERGDISFYDTGVIIEPPEGYYTELIARSSLFKMGYMLANGVGVIDNDYRGTIKVPLIKVSDGPDLELPCRCVQLVLRKKINVSLKEVDKSELTTTQRGDGGFGSTN